MHQADHTHRLQVKYCERCGRLWLRPAESREPYCDRCRPLMDSLPRLGHYKPQRRKK